MRAQPEFSRSNHARLPCLVRGSARHLPACRPVVLFVDDDEPKIGIGRNKAERAPTITETSFAATASQVCARLPRRDLRVPFGWPRAEAAGEAVEKLGGQRNFRHKDQGLPLAPDIFGNCFEVDSVFPEPGDPVQQGHSIAALLNRLAHISAAATVRARIPAWLKSGSGGSATGSGGSPRFRVRPHRSIH